MFTYAYTCLSAMKTFVANSLPIKIALAVFVCPFILAALYFGGIGLFVLVCWSFETLWDWMFGLTIVDYGIPD